MLLEFTCLKWAKDMMANLSTAKNMAKESTITKTAIFSKGSIKTTIKTQGK